MRIVNDGLPEPLYKAVCDQREPTGEREISVTQLIAPPQIRQLTREHWDSLTENASDRIWLADGNAMHALLEKYGDGPDQMVEEMMEADVYGWRVFGTFDHFDTATGVLTDYKRVGMAALYRGVKTEWEEQLNCYAWLLRENGYTVNAIQICAIYRDWVKTQTVKHDYPQKPVEVLPVSLWSASQQLDFIGRRLEKHEEVPDCTDEERWATSTRYAVKKRGNKKATAVYDTQAEADQHVLLNKPSTQWEIDKRPGMYRRCETYCAVAAFCPQWTADSEDSNG